MSAVSGEADLAGLLAGGAETVLLAQAGTQTEAGLIRKRVAAAGGKDVPVVSLGPEGVPGDLLAGNPDVRLVPVRVAWLPEERGGRRVARAVDLLPGHDPYQPSESRQRRILTRAPGHARVLAGQPATVGSLRQRWLEATDGHGDEAGFADYVARRATLALDRAEYRLRGPRYKTPSLVKEEILASRRFRAGLRELRDETPVPSEPGLAHVA